MVPEHIPAHVSAGSTGSDRTGAARLPPPCPTPTHEWSPGWLSQPAWTGAEALWRGGHQLAWPLHGWAGWTCSSTRGHERDKEWEENHCMGSCRICSLSKDSICHLRAESPHGCLHCRYRAVANALGRAVHCPFTLVQSDCGADFHVCPALGGPPRALVLQKCAVWVCQQRQVG